MNQLPSDEHSAALLASVREGNEAAFAALLEEETDLPYVFYDERLSTVSAHRFLSMTDVGSKKRKAVVDTLSAEIILQSYLDSLKK